MSERIYTYDQAYFAELDAAARIESGRPSLADEERAEYEACPMT